MHRNGFEETTDCVKVGPCLLVVSPNELVELSLQYQLASTIITNQPPARTPSARAINALDRDVVGTKPEARTGQFAIEIFQGLKVRCVGTGQGA